MSIKSGVFSAITAVVLIGALGNRGVIDNLPIGGPAPIAMRSVAAFFSWDPDRVFEDFRTATYLALVVFVIAVAVLGAAAGRARPLAAFVGGWGAAVGAAALSGVVFSLVAGERADFRAQGEVIDRAYEAASNGAGVMVAVGWLFGVAVLLGSFGAKQPKPASTAGHAPPPPGGPPPGYGAPTGWNDPAPSYAPPPANAPAGAERPTPAYGTPGPAPSPPPPASPPPASSPTIGPPPDRTQVFGQPPQ